METTLPPGMPNKRSQLPNFLLDLSLFCEDEPARTCMQSGDIARVRPFIMRFRKITSTWYASGFGHAGAGDVVMVLVM